MCGNQFEQPGMGQVNPANWNWGAVDWGGLTKNILGPAGLAYMMQQNAPQVPRPEVSYSTMPSNVLDVLNKDIMSSVNSQLNSRGLYGSGLGTQAMADALAKNAIRSTTGYQYQPTAQPSLLGYLPIAYQVLRSMAPGSMGGMGNGTNPTTGPGLSYGGPGWDKPMGYPGTRYMPAQ